MFLSQNRQVEFEKGSQLFIRVHHEPRHGSGRTAACHVLISESRNYRQLVSKGFEEGYEHAEPSLTTGEFGERLHSGNIYARKYYMRAY